MLSGAQALNTMLAEWNVVGIFNRLCVEMDQSDLMDVMNVYAKQLQAVKYANAYPSKWADFTYLGDNKETPTSIGGAVHLRTPNMGTLVTSQPTYSYLINYTTQVLEVSVIKDGKVMINASMNKDSCKFYQAEEDQHLNQMLARCLKRIVVSDCFPLSRQCIKAIDLVEEQRWAALC